MTDEPDGEVGYSLVMPFVVTASNGGPFDDAAFTAGFEMGVLHQRCALMDAMQVPAVMATIRRVNLPQADLIAMHYAKFCTRIEDDTLDEQISNEWAGIIIGVDDLSDEERS